MGLSRQHLIIRVDPDAEMLPELSCVKNVTVVTERYGPRTPDVYITTHFHALPILGTVVIWLRHMPDTPNGLGYVHPCFPSIWAAHNDFITVLALLNYIANEKNNGEVQKYKERCIRCSKSYPCDC